MNEEQFKQAVEALRQLPGFEKCLEKASQIVKEHATLPDGVVLMNCCGGPPSVPSPYQAVGAATAAQLEMLPFYYQLAATAALGGSGTMQVPTYNKKGKITGYHTVNYNLPSSAQVNRQLSDFYTQSALDLNNKYSSQIVQQQRRMLQESDPEGWAARQRLAGATMGDLNATYDRPMAGELERQIMADLLAGGKLDEQTAREVSQATRRGQAARGNILGDASSFQEAMETGSAAENRRVGRQGRALQFLSSGQGAEDTNYRRHQQALSNLGAFLSGTPPQGQFNAVPQAQFSQTYQPGNPNINPTAGLSYAASTYGPYVSGAMQQEANRLNAWNSGIGAAGTLVGGVLGAI